MSDTVAEQERAEAASEVRLDIATESVAETRVAAPPEPSAEPFAESREEIESPQDRLIDSVTAGQQDALDSVESAGTAVVAGLGLAHRAFAEFVAERIRQDFATQRALLGSRSIDEARTIGFAHIRTTVDQYGREVSRMVRLGTTVTRHSLESRRRAASGA